MSKTTFNPKVITSVKINGEDFPIAISIIGNSRLEKKYNKPISEIISNDSAEYVIDMVAEAVKGGARLHKKELNYNGLSEEEFFASIIDNDPTVYGDIRKTYDDAFAKYYRIQIEGN